MYGYWLSRFNWESRRKNVQWLHGTIESLRADPEPWITFHDDEPFIAETIEVAERLLSLMEQEHPKPEAIDELYKLLKLYKAVRNSDWDHICKYVEAWNWAMNRCSGFEGAIQFDLWGGVDCVPYTIANQVAGEGKFVRIAGKYGHVKLLVEPYVGQSQVCLEWRVEDNPSSEDDTVPKEYLPAIFESLIDVMIERLRGGILLTNIKVIVCGGSYHLVDSSEISYKIAAVIAFRAILDKTELVRTLAV
ncbi:hypothetical protein [Pantanalinema sp. GBBB05]|uniref:hypothetical protein n=1 Tax=Pantanalinema sp. GBBB05 TaxID=2604139 RepID=UPI001DDAFBF4|nr:hypothetical protein [Pantanalinema sp. GBBB05]